MYTVLVVDDEKNYLLILEDLLLEDGYRVLTASSAAEALNIITNDVIDTVVTDIKMPGLTGIDLLDRVLTHDPELPVIVMTAFAEVDQAVAAMKKGALDHIQKPFDNTDFKNAVARGVEKRALVKHRRTISDTQQPSADGIVGESKVIQDALLIVKKVADTPITVLVSGESGTGKELVARSIHRQSRRADKTFISINCAAMTESLLESELFGYEKGAFTGALTTKAGKFEAAQGGSLFLDEIGDMPPTLQVKLLRVLQEQEFSRVGGSKDIKVDVRIIAATNKNLKHEVESGAFRGDLYYRLNGVHIELPPLRERREDIPLLTAHFLNTVSHKLERVVTSVEPEVVRTLTDYDWPGNVRELEHVIERAVVFCSHEKVRLRDLPPEITVDPSKQSTPLYIPSTEKTLAETLDAIEEEIIKDALNKTGNVQAQAARSLGISRSNLQYKMKKYGLL